MMWLKKGLKKAHEELTLGFRRLFGLFPQFNPDDLQQVEEILLRADLGPATVFPLLERVRQNLPRGAELPQLVGVLEKELLSLLRDGRGGLADNPAGLAVVFFVGVNGTGKTTTLAKLANHLKKKGKKVLIASCDTFRAAAADQLKIWGDRLGIDVVQHGPGADAAAVAFDAVKAALTRKADYLLCDTAGRLHNKEHLMEELKKIKRVVAKEVPGAPHETLLVVDATTGQNGLIQAKKFHEEMQVSGIVVSKLDGTAKAGIVVAIEKELKIPVKFVGVGEQVDDFAPFSPQEYVKGLFEN